MEKLKAMTDEKEKNKLIVIPINNSSTLLLNRLKKQKEIFEKHPIKSQLHSHIIDFINSFLKCFYYVEQHIEEIYMQHIKSKTDGNIIIDLNAIMKEAVDYIFYAIAQNSDWAYPLFQDYSTVVHNPSKGGAHFPTVLWVKLSRVLIDSLSSENAKKGKEQARWEGIIVFGKDSKPITIDLFSGIPTVPKYIQIFSYPFEYIFRVNFFIFHEVVGHFITPRILEKLNQSDKDNVEQEFIEEIVGDYTTIVLGFNENIDLWLHLYCQYVDISDTEELANFFIRYYVVKLMIKNKNNEFKKLKDSINEIQCINSFKNLEEDIDNFLKNISKKYISDNNDKNEPLFSERDKRDLLKNILNEFEQIEKGLDQMEKGWDDLKEMLNKLEKSSALLKIKKCYKNYLEQCKKDGKSIIENLNKLNNVFEFFIKLHETLSDIKDGTGEKNQSK